MKRRPRVMRSQGRIICDTLKALRGGVNTQSKLLYGQPISYKTLKPYLKALEDAGLILRRDASDDELCRDSRSKWYIEITEEGRGFIRDLEALDKRSGGLLLGKL